MRTKRLQSERVTGATAFVSSAMLRSWLTAARVAATAIALP